MLSASMVFVSRNEKLGGYEVWGWRYLDEAVWRVKLWTEMGARHENAFLVTDGEFEPETALLAEKLIVLKLLKKWEAESPKGS
jgi:hypothetical protein